MQILFATETFSTGLNMPARTVAFAGARKFDGVTFRNISGGEYIQMSGRAGRRGLDKIGTVILMCDQRLNAAAAKDIVRGRPDALRSAFRLAYPSLLSVLRLDTAQARRCCWPCGDEAMPRCSLEAGKPIVLDRARQIACAQGYTVYCSSVLHTLLSSQGTATPALHMVPASPQCR